MKIFNHSISKMGCELDGSFFAVLDDTRMTQLEKKMLAWNLASFMSF